MAPKKRLKTTATPDVPQSRDDVVNDIKVIGDIQRQITRLEAEMNDRIGLITEEYSAPVANLQARLATLQKGVQAWCEAHRLELTNNGKVKTANLVTGEVQWRCRPPSVTVRGTDMVLQLLEEKGLDRFIRVTSSVNKEAILADPLAIAGIPGLTIKSSVEDFAIVPFEQEVQ
ncbi:host-nuclease inhibitor Gam family protein [Metapseudomonas otitidis]|uniref:host-nuclease inhibitor Gam family protein n=1 Tax=Metapseudomonas otitidis TaxID=319939 RepID=UPI003CECE999